MNNKYLKLLIKCVDLIIIMLVISFLIYDFFSLIENLFNLSLNNEFVSYMVDNSKNVNSHTTTVQVIHNEGSWSNGIRSLFIYGTGALRISLLKGGGTPTAKGFIIASTVGAEAVRQKINNAINDPKYILSHIESWKTIWDGKSETAHVYVEGDKESSKIVDSIANSSSSSSSSNSVSNIDSSTSISNNFISDGNTIDALYNKIVAYIMNILGPILEPVKVSYSNELLANQLYNISIMLFILSILIIFMIIGFMINILIYHNSDRIINYFTNKYIKWYVNFNKKIIGIELFFIGSTILYFMYILSYGLHFLATHPITFT
jgi:hypothetical protein